MCTTDIEAPWFCLHTIGLLNKICSLSGMCFLFIKKKQNLRLIQALLITLILEELQVRRRGKEAEMLKCVSIWRANGWSVCYRVEWSAGRWLLQKREKSGGQMCTGRNADTPSSSQMLMFTLVISIKSPICPASFWLYLSSKSLHMTGIKITFIYSTLTCLRAACMNVERLDAIKATPIRSNKNPSRIKLSFVKLTTSSFSRCLSHVLMHYFVSVPLILKTNTRTEDFSAF